MPSPATFYVVTSGGNDIWFRCEAPAEALGARVSRILEGSKINEPNTGTGLPWSMVLTGEDGGKVQIDTKHRYEQVSSGHIRYVAADAVFPQHEGVAVFTRPDVDRAALGLTMHQQGIRTVAEADDNYLVDAHLNLFLRQQGADGLTREAHARAMASFDANVFSTGWLRDRYAKDYRQRFGKQRAKRVEMHVCRNHIPASAWPDRVERDGPLRVGFMGSPSHVWDANLSYSAFHAAKHGGCETWMVGYNPGNIDQERRLPEKVELADGSVIEPRSQKSLDVEAAWAKVVDHHVPWVAPADFHRAALPFDIGVAPLHYNDFTCGKSDSKALEYTISGAACVLATNPAYTQAGWVHEQNCLLANSPEDYGYQTLRLIRDPKLRYELVTAAQEMVRAERNGDVLASEWRQALFA